MTRTLIDEADPFGRTTKHTDLGGHVFGYSYNSTGWLTYQSSSNETYHRGSTPLPQPLSRKGKGERCEPLRGSYGMGNRTYEGYSRIVAAVTPYTTPGRR